MSDSNFPNVKMGDQDQEGTNVRKVQYLLRERGTTVAVDGIFGPKTDNAVRTFQQANQLVVDGIVGTNTWSKLIIEIQRGSVGDAVRAVQSQFPFLAVDGDFGVLTGNAVRGFQTHSGLDDDGIVGPHTWRALTLSPKLSDF